MKKLLKSHIPMTLVVAVCLFLSFPTTTHDFVSLWSQLARFRLLIEKVHDEHWDIFYSFGEDCPEERRAAPEELEAAITEALQMWLQPLREIETKAPIVNEFRFQLYDEITNELLRELRQEHDLAVTDYCKLGLSLAGMGNSPPWIFLNGGENVDDQYRSILIHELGHAFGLGDTYVGRREKELSVSTGGLKRTVGTQPASVMGRHIDNRVPQFISEDDENGIVWLYKVTYDNLFEDDCFFPNYKFEESPEGCVPKSPLIFEIRQGFEVYALQVLEEDRGIDINAQDDTGATALIYAIRGRQWEVVEALLSRGGLNVNLRDESDSTALHYAILNRSTRDIKALLSIKTLLSHEDIWIRPRNKAGKTPIDLARDLGDENTLDLLLKHPNQHLSVAPKGKLATTWGELKQF